MVGEKKGLFGKKEEPTGPNIQDVLNQITNIDSRLRLIEGRSTDLNRKVQVTEKNMLDERKIVTKEIKVINSDIIELKREINEIKNKITLIITELKNTARKEDLETIRKYVELWEPVKFVTIETVEKIIEEKLQK